MTTMGMTHGPGRTVAPLAASGSTLWRVLLACGLASSLLYLATDVLGGLRYEGYSFTSQAISELGAIGAPSKSLVDPLFLAYDVLALAFGIAVIREAAGRGWALRITGVLLAAHALVGLAGVRGFEMQQRGAGSLATDLRHIVLTSVIVSLLLAAIGVGAFALGRRFRIYSLATLATVIAFAALTGVYAPRLAAGQPTPGLGIVERIDVYSIMLWLAVFSVALLRHPNRAAPAPEGP
jgi:hypothetical membrane protein